MRPIGRNAPRRLGAGALRWLGLGLLGGSWVLGVPANAQTYGLGFNSGSDRMTWTPKIPSWRYAVPVAMSAPGDSTSMLQISASASLGAILNQRSSGNTWQENASLRTAVTYPILGPKASIGISASASSRSATLLKQKNRSQTLSFRFQYRPLAGGDGTFQNLRVDLTPGLITARRASRANLDSTIEERGLQYTASLSVSPNWELADEKVTSSFSLSKRDNTLESNKNRSENLRLSAGYTLPHGVRATLAVSERRTQLGVTRVKILPDSTEAGAGQDTVVADIGEQRSTSVSSTVSFELAGFDVTSSHGWSGSRNTNSANADGEGRNRYFARDRESDRWNTQTSLSGKLPGGVVSRGTVSFKASSQRRLPVELAGDMGCGDRAHLVGVSQDGSTKVCRDVTDDLEDRDLSLSGSLDWQVAEDHSLELSGTTSLIRVSNPGAPEQDRDTHNQNLTVTFRSALDSGMRLDASLSTSNTHRVNLEASRASQNSRNREIRLKVNTGYQRLATSFSHHFELSARRTIFDFDRQVNPADLSRKSNIRRGWSMRHSARRPLFEHLQLSAGYTYRADDFGILLVGDDLQIVEEDNTDHRITFGMNYRPSGELSLGMSYSYRLDRQWEYLYTARETARELAFRNAHRNLSADLSYTPAERTSLSLRAGRSVQRSGTFDRFSATLSRRV